MAVHAPVCVAWSSRQISHVAQQCPVKIVCFVSLHCKYSFYQSNIQTPGKLESNQPNHYSSSDSQLMISQQFSLESQSDNQLHCYQSYHLEVITQADYSSSIRDYTYNM